MEAGAQEAAFVEDARAITTQRYSNLDSKDYTSIIDAVAYTRLVAALDEARERGAQIINLLPGPAIDPASRRIAPHLVLGAPADCALMQREIFRPDPARDLL